MPEDIKYIYRVVVTNPDNSQEIIGRYEDYQELLSHKNQLLDGLDIINAHVRIFEHGRWAFFRWLRVPATQV